MKFKSTDFGLFGLVHSMWGHGVSFVSVFSVLWHHLIERNNFSKAKFFFLSSWHIYTWGTVHRVSVTVLLVSETCHPLRAWASWSEEFFTCTCSRSLIPCKVTCQTAQDVCPHNEGCQSSAIALVTTKWGNYLHEVTNEVTNGTEAKAETYSMTYYIVKFLESYR